MRKFLLCFWLALALPAWAAEIKIDFADFTTGKTPAGFHEALAGGGQPGDWKIVMDEVPSAFTPLTSRAPIVNHQAVLAQTSEDPTDERFPMLVYDGGIFQNFKMTTQFKIVSGGAEQMAGIVFRFQNTSNFYVLRASALGHNVRFYKVVGGIRSDPIGPQLDVSTGFWHTLAVQCDGNQIICSFDNKLLMPPLNDSSFAFGKIGFWTKSDAVSYFGDTTIDYTPRIPLAQALVQNILRKEPRILGLRIYAFDDKSEIHVIASNDEKEIGRPGEAAEKNAITAGTVSFGRGTDTVAVVLPLRDRNGDPMAAVWVRLKSFFGETQDNAVMRATMIIHQMQAQALTSADLGQ